MFIRELQVDGYGTLQNFSCELEQAPVTVVFGPNEAGKSTLLRFIRSMLYGIPNRKDPVERGEPVYGGRHGGRMTVTTNAGRELFLERYADGGGAGRKTAGGLIVRQQDGTALGWTQAEWERQALGGVSERLFRQLFAVSLDELHELRTLQGEEIGNFLYHAGLAGGAALSEARRKLAGEMDKLYRPRGTTQEMNRILASMKETEAAIRQSRSGIVLFQEAEEAWMRTEEGIGQLAKAVPSLSERVAELQGALNLRDWWLKRQLLIDEDEDLKKQLPHASLAPLSEEASSAWSSLLRNRQQAVERLETAVRTAQDRRAELESFRWDESLLGHTAELEKLEAMRVSVVARQEESESLAAELRLLEDTVQTLLSRLSPEWDVEDLIVFGSVTSEREPLRRLQQTWAEAERLRERLEADAGRLHRQREALLAELSTSTSASSESAKAAVAPDGDHSAFGGFRATNRESLLRAWNALEDEVRRLERARSEALFHVNHKDASTSTASDTKSTASGKGKQTAGAPSKSLFVVAGLLVLSAAVLLFLGSNAKEGGVMSPLLVAGTAVLAILAVSAFWTGVRRRNRGRSPNAAATIALLQTLKEQQSRVVERLHELLVQPDRVVELLLQGSVADRSQHFAASSINEEIWRRLRQAVQEQLTQMEYRQRELAHTQDLQRRLGELDREKAALQKEILQAVDHLNELKREWEDWLRGRKLPTSLTPDILPELLSMAEQGQTAVRRRARTLERKEALDQLQSAFRQTAATLFDACPPPATMGADTALSVTWLYRRSMEQRTIKEDAQRTERSLEQAEAAAAESKKALEEAEMEIAHAIRQADAEDEGSYERRLRIDERRRNLLRERKEAELRMEAGRTEQSAARLYELLQTLDEAALTTALRQAEEAWKAADLERTGLLDRRGRLAQELERLQREAETEDRLLHLSELESSLDQLAERYAILAICDRLLKETKAVFEEERQPEVLRLASRYFSQMSAGAYTRITAPADSSAIYAETEDRRVTDSAFLSRGTQEQLYLAMRFALAEAASREVPLPLLLDDLFVHFDERRLRQTVPVLGEISQTRQVILFTCHRHVATAIQEGWPAARVISWAVQGALDRPQLPGYGLSGTASPS